MCDELVNLLSLPVSSLCCVCRLCASVIDATSAVSIFRAGEDLTVKINRYLPITVEESDPFPKTICNLCAEQLHRFHDLVQKCLLFEEHLHRTLDICTPVELDVSDGLDTAYDTSKDDPFNLSSPLDESIQSISPAHEESFPIVGAVEIGVPCQVCNDNLPNFEKCLHHQKEHVNGDKCVVCGYQSNSVIDLNVHLSKHFGNTLPPQVKKKPKGVDIIDKAQPCMKCEKVLLNFEDAVIHCKSHRPTDVSSYSCVVCLACISSIDLDDHMTSHFQLTTVPLACDACANEYPNEKALKYHRCMELRKHKCKLCKLGFKTEARLRFHEDFHNSKRTFCEICKKDFKYESRIYLHLSAAHQGEKDNPFCCDICGKTFRWLKTLETHQRTHTNDRPFACEKCSSKFCSKATLSAHLFSHESAPRLHCMRCDYSTCRKLNLLNHVSRFHKEVKKSQVVVCCNECSEVFPNAYDMELESHLHPFCDPHRKKAEETIVTKLYQCERCDRCFSSVEHLSQHRLIHQTDEINMLFRCRLCDFGFSRHDLLVRHRKVHNNVTSRYSGQLTVLIVFLCDRCGIECVDYTQLLNHKERSNCLERMKNGTLRPKTKLISTRLRPLKAHELNVNSDGLFECLFCLRTYKNRRRYRLHLATHNS